MKQSFFKPSEYLNKWGIFLLAVVAGAWAVFLFSIYSNIFGGDPEIHLIFAKNLLKGFPLQFNPGYFTGGETSPLYMLIVAAFYSLFHEFTQYAMKGIGVASAAWIALILYFANPSGSSLNKLLGPVLFCSMAFVPFQAMLGMENMLFSACLTTLVFLDFKNPNLPKPFILISSLTLFLLRPEGILFPLYYGLKSLIKKDKNSIAWAVASVIACLALYKILNFYTGVDTQNAAQIRSYTSKIAAFAFAVGPIQLYLSTKTLVAFSYSLPLLLAIGIFKNRLLSHHWVALTSFVAVPFFLHLFTIFPDTHISRYLLYSYAILFLVFSCTVLSSAKFHIIFIVFAYILSISFAEFQARKSISLGGVHTSVQQMGETNIKKYSDLLLKSMNESETANKKISIATTEVQLRGRLDERFLIWSLDGITDSSLGRFVESDSIDLFSYLNHRNIKYLQDLPNYNINQSTPSLRELKPDQLSVTATSTPCLNGYKIKEAKNFNGFFETEKC